MGMSKTSLARVISACTWGLPDQVRAIFAKYETSLHIPGVSGALRFGFQPGNYRESTGQTLAAADQQVGFVVDAARVPGPQLVTNGDFSAALAAPWYRSSSTDFSWSASGGELTLTGTSTGGAYQSVATQAGKVYEVTGRIRRGTATDVRLRAVTPTWAGTTLSESAVVTSTASTEVRCVFTANGSSTDIYLRNNGAGSGIFSAISVRELPGIHASQSTSGFQPVLRNEGGIQSLQFDAALSQRLSLSAVPFQMADDHCAIIGCTATALGDRYMFGIRSSSNTQPVVAAMRFTAANGIEAFYRNDAGSSVAPTIAGGAAINEPMVVTARSVGSSLMLRKNGIVGATATKPSGATTVNTATLGASVTTTASQFWHGHQHAAVFLVGAPSDSELLTIERFIAGYLQLRSL